MTNYLFLYTGKVCLCTTNCHLYHKDPCPERGLNHSKVVLYFRKKVIQKRLLDSFINYILLLTA
ncbi:hypothetical protein CRM71_09885 [Prevotella jejuni]|nr:hypothetical protein CRM71_09885 [Prevotella jejuni]